MTVVSLSQTTTADNPIILSYAPAGIVNKIRIKAEFPLSEKLSTGAFVSYHYAYFKGPVIEPFLRMYISDECPKGFYMQFKVSAGYYSSKMEFIHIEADSTTTTIKQKHSFPGFGAGLAFGYQYITRKGGLFDFFVGYKLMPFLGPDFVNYQNSVYRTEDDFTWYILGPGSRINCHFGIGYSF